MESILRGIYNGKIIPWERRAPKNEELLDLIRRIEDEERYFMQKLSPDDCGRFQALSNLHSELNFVEEGNVFSYGFTLGLLLAMDVTREAETIRVE